MEKKTIGQFIATLRKANGMTQQEVADRLNVSNKAISRWERDECAPDITLIPALAEMFGVTCDELLKGERIFNSENEGKREAKVEKQVRTLIRREISKYKTMMSIAVLVAVAGGIVMYILDESLFMNTDGSFFTMLLFELTAFVIVTIAVNKMRDVKEDCELFEKAETLLVEKYNKCLGETAFHVYFLIAAIVVWIVITMPYMFPQFTGYGVAIVVLVVIYGLGKRRYIAWATDTQEQERMRRKCRNDRIADKIVDVINKWIY